MKLVVFPFMLAWLCFGGLAASACHLNVSRQGEEYSAVVVGASPPEETKRQTEIAMMITGGKPTERYVPLPRILADFRDSAGVMHRVISAVTDGAIPQPGAKVTLRSRYLDPDDDCRFIPWTVVPTAPTS